MASFINGRFIDMDSQKLVLYPTGSCFDDAIDYINALCIHEPWNIKMINKQWRVVHGICLFDDGKRYAHCWLTKANSCYDFRLLHGVKVMIKYTRSDFQKRHRHIKQVPYSIRDCCHQEKALGYCGPWDPEIRKLCPDLSGKI